MAVGYACLLIVPWIQRSTHASSIAENLCAYQPATAAGPIHQRRSGRLKECVPDSDSLDLRVRSVDSFARVHGRSVIATIRPPQNQRAHNFELVVSRGNLKLGQCLRSYYETINVRVQDTATCGADPFQHW
jgi:hypothetical protein